MNLKIDKNLGVMKRDPVTNEWIPMPVTDIGQSLDAATLADKKQDGYFQRSASNAFRDQIRVNPFGDRW